MRESEGLTLEDIKEGMTAKRNQILVNALDKVDFIENYASGVRRIFKDYEDFYKKPEYHISENGVVLILYNRNYEFGNVGKDVGKGIGRLTKVEKRRKQLMEMMANNSGITIAELSNE